MPRRKYVHFIEDLIPVVVWVWLNRNREDIIEVFDLARHDYYFESSGCEDVSVLFKSESECDLVTISIDLSILSWKHFDIVVSRAFKIA